MVLSQGSIGSRTPERPTQQPVRRRRRHSKPLSSGLTATMAPTPDGLSGLSTPTRQQTPGRQSTRSGSGSGVSRSGSFAGPRSRSSNCSSHEEGGVRVVVRVRPLCEEDEAKRGDRTMRCCNPKTLEFASTPTLAGTGGGGGVSGAGGDAAGGGSGGGGGAALGDGSRQYTFDLCAHEGFDQEEMFQSCGLMPLLSAAINGYAGMGEQDSGSTSECVVSWRVTDCAPRTPREREHVMQSVVATHAMPVQPPFF